MSRARWLFVGAAVLALAGAWLAEREVRRGERVVRPGVEEEHGASESAVLQPLAQPAAGEREARSAEDARAADEASAAEREPQLVVRVVAKETQAPLADVCVALHAPQAPWKLRGESPRGRAGETLKTDAQGRAEFQAEPDVEYALEVDVHDDGRAGVHQSVPSLRAAEQRELVVALPTQLDLVWYGRVLDGETNEPLAGARVRRVTGDPFARAEGEPVAVLSDADGIVARSDADGIVARSDADGIVARSDTDGIVRLDAASWATSCARIELARYAPGRAVIEEGHAEPGAAFTVLLYRAAELELLAHDAAGAPRADLAVSLSCESWDLLQGTKWKMSRAEPPAWEGRTDEQGRCVLADLPARIGLTLEVRAGEELVRREERSLWLDPGERRTLDLTLGGGCEILGRALEGDGRPAEGVEVWLLAAGSRFLETRDGDEVVASARSAADGSFRFERVGAGAWRVGPAPTREPGPARADFDAASAIAPLAQELVIAPEQSLASVTLTCWRGLYIAGRVVNPDGSKGSGVIVFAVGDGFAAMDNPFEGRFRIGPLVPGAYQVSVHTFSDGFAAPEPVTVPAGAQDLVLELRRGGALVARVLDSRGNPAASAMVMVFREGPSYLGDLGMQTDSDGTIEFNGCLPGTYTLSVSTPEGEFARASGVRVAVDAAPAEVELRLEPAARLRISGQPAGNLVVRVEQDGQRIAFAGLAGDPLVVVPAGELELVLTTWGLQPEELQRRKVRAVLGQETEVVFDLGPSPR